MENLYNLIFPPKCELCGNAGVTVCHSCLGKSKLMYSQRCICCDKLSVQAKTHSECSSKDTPVSFYALFVYEGILRLAITRAKYNARKHIVLKNLTEFGLSQHKFSLRTYFGYTVVPIPLSSKKQVSRGFNQAEIIARAVSKFFSLEMSVSTLRRVKSTQVQHEKNRLERFRSLSGAFSAKKDISGLKILLVDDISTTGATFLEAAKALYHAGAAEVSCLSLSKTLRLPDYSSDVSK